MAVKQYPYQLRVLSVIDGGKDADGNNIPPTETWTDYCNCRDEAGNGKLIASVDGSMISYSFLVQIPKGIETIDPGISIRVMDGDVIRCTGRVIYSRKDQLHGRLWV